MPRPDPRASADYMRGRYQRRRAAGLCTRCGGEPRPGRATCAACRAYEQAAQAKHHAKAASAIGGAA